MLCRDVVHLVGVSADVSCNSPLILPPRLPSATLSSPQIRRHQKAGMGTFLNRLDG